MRPLDRLEVRERAAEPARGDVGHAAARRLDLDRLLRLLLRADEEHRLAVATATAAREVHRLLEQRDGLLEVDDVDAVALGEDVALHARVPAVGLVSEVDAGFEQGLHRRREGKVRSR